MGKARGTNGEKRKAYMLLVGKPEGRTPLERPRYKWVDNVKMDLEEICWGDVDWIDVAQDQGLVESSCEDGNEPSGSIKCWEVLR
jgi:hypothetical protein